jgi:heme-degrading monooxygenase HmoA
MPALEILQLQLAPGISPDDPSVLQNMINVRTALRERIYNTNSRCYQCIEDPTLIYIFGIWPNLAAHKTFVNSPLKSEVLGLQQDQTKFKWMLHIELDDINLLPFDAPVMAIARLHIKDGEHVIEHSRILEEHRGLIVEATKPYNVVDAWRCDSAPGKHESIVISGWDSVEAHEAFTERIKAGNKEYASARDHYEAMEVMHAKNMER